MAIEGCVPQEDVELSKLDWLPEVVREFMRRRSLSDAVSFPLFITAYDVEQFCNLVRDWNPIHVDVVAARSLGFRERVVPALLLSGFLAQCKEYETLVHCVDLRITETGASYDQLRPAYANEDILIKVWTQKWKCAKTGVHLTIRYRILAAVGGKTVLVGERKLFLAPF